VGCHHLDNGKWQEVPCASEEDMRKLHIRSPLHANSIQSTPYRPFFGANQVSGWYVNSLVWGSVSILFMSDPTQATETDIQNPGAVPSPPQPNAFSIQTNTNTFTCTTCTSGYPLATSNPGDQAWVQFVYWQDPEIPVGRPSNPDSGLCVWSWDLTPNSDMYTTDQTSFMQCVYPSKILSVPPAPLTGPGAAAWQFGEVVGYVTCPFSGNVGCLLISVAYLPWVGGWWSVGAPDYMGLSGNWTNVTGSILGEGGGSTATFTNTQISQTVIANSCFVAPQDAATGGYGPQPCSAPPIGPYGIVLGSLGLHAGPALVPNDASGESNNLNNGSVTFQCIGYECWLSYNSASPDLPAPQ
jgi:hypothetical protein